MRLSGVFFEPLSSKKLIGEIKIADKRELFSEGNLICNDIGIETYQNKQIFIYKMVFYLPDYPLTNEQEKSFQVKLRGISC